MATTTTNKQKLTQQLMTALVKAGKWAEPATMPVLEQFIYAIFREGTTREAADAAFARLRERFFDWNEIRVTSAGEIADVVKDLVGDAEARGQRLVDLLQEVFESTFSFDLESMHKKGAKPAAKQLSRYQAANDYAVAWVVQKSLGSHAIPLDEPSIRVLRRAGLLDDTPNDPEVLRTGLEHHVPKAKSAEFVDLVSMVAEEYCWEADPNCPSCPLCKTCVTGMETKMTATAGTSKKPR